MKQTTLPPLNPMPRAPSAESAIRRSADQPRRSEELHYPAGHCVQSKYPAELLSRSRSLECPLTVMADSYKAGHFKMYPAAKAMSAYGEFRKPFEHHNPVPPFFEHAFDEEGRPDGVKPVTKEIIRDDRILFYGLRHYIEQFISRAISEDDITRSEKFYSEHCAGGTAYPSPKKIMDRIAELGYFPVKIRALPEGSVVYPHVPVFIITAEEQYSHFCTFLETILTMVWYPSCVATLSRHSKTVIQKAFKETVSDDKQWMLDSRLHDFGFRGCTCVEQSVLGGSAHLLNFTGSDTMSAAYHVQFHLNKGNPVAQSIMATEHSVMTSWKSEIDAIRHLIQECPKQIIACVMDSYNYDNALANILPAIKEELTTSECTFIIRPDSGNPVKQVVKALQAAERAGYACPLNKRGFKEFEKIGVIQGDGINYSTICDILDAVRKECFSAANVAFGMGGGLLQKVNRDSMSFATKLSYIKYADSTERSIIKAPSTDAEKWSLPGKLGVVRTKSDQCLHVIMESEFDVAVHEDAMVTVYDHGKINDDYMSETFDMIKARVERQWSSATPKRATPVISYKLAFERLCKATEIHKWTASDVVPKHEQLFKEYAVDQATRIADRIALIALADTNAPSSLDALNRRLDSMVERL